MRNGDRLVPDLLLVGRDAGRLASWRPPTATCAGPRTWTRRWPGRTRSSWIAPPPAIGRRACARRSRRASTSISKSRPRPRSTRRWSWRAWPTRAGVKHGVIQDKLFLPGFAKLLFVKNAGILRPHPVDPDRCRLVDLRRHRRRNASGRAGTTRRAEGGGLALDMMAHWRYMIDRLAAPVTGVCALMAHRHPGAGGRARATLRRRCRGHLARAAEARRAARSASSPTAGRRGVRRDDTMVVQIDGTLGSAVAGRVPLLHPSGGQHARGLLRRRPARRHGFRGAMAGGAGYAAGRIPSGSAGKRSCATSPRMRRIVPTLVEGAKAVQLADLAYRSVAEERWMTVPDLKL